MADKSGSRHDYALCGETCGSGKREAGGEASGSEPHLLVAKAADVDWGGGDMCWNFNIN
ncbi:MAG: hypothetical protein ACI4E1_10215 [Lachnospira sp.]